MFVPSQSFSLHKNIDLIRAGRSVRSAREQRIQIVQNMDKVPSLTLFSRRASPGRTKLRESYMPRYEDPQGGQFAHFKYRDFLEQTKECLQPTLKKIKRQSSELNSSLRRTQSKPTFSNLSCFSDFPEVRRRVWNEEVEDACKQNTTESQKSQSSCFQDTATYEEREKNNFPFRERQNRIVPEPIIEQHCYQQNRHFFKSDPLQLRPCSQGTQGMTQGTPLRQELQSYSHQPQHQPQHHPQHYPQHQHQPQRQLQHQYQSQPLRFQQYEQPQFQQTLHQPVIRFSNSPAREGKNVVAPSYVIPGQALQHPPTHPSPQITSEQCSLGLTNFSFATPFPKQETQKIEFKKANGSSRIKLEVNIEQQQEKEKLSLNRIPFSRSNLSEEVVQKKETQQEVVDRIKAQKLAVQAQEFKNKIEQIMERMPSFEAIFDRQADFELQEKTQSLLHTLLHFRDDEVEDNSKTLAGLDEILSHHQQSHHQWSRHQQSRHQQNERSMDSIKIDFHRGERAEMIEFGTCHNSKFNQDLHEESSRPRKSKFSLRDITQRQQHSK